jgi:hypothetical protein
MSKQKLTAEEKFTNIDFPLFDALAALDKKDYGFFDRLTTEQQKGFSPFMLLHWLSTVSGVSDLQRYYLQNTDYTANKNMFHENITKHNKLQWLMLCAVSPGMGKQFHKWIPHIKRNYTLLLEEAKAKEIQDYFAKVYPNTQKEVLSEISEEFTRIQKRKYKLAQLFPNLKVSDIEILNEVVTDEQISEYEKDCGN